MISPNKRYVYCFLGGMLLLALLVIFAGNITDKKANVDMLQGPADAIMIYKQRCMQCHGDRLQGWMGSASNIQKVGQRLSKADIINTIQNGGHLMPALGDQIKQADIEKVASLLANQK